MATLKSSHFHVKRKVKRASKKEPCGLTANVAGCKFPIGKIVIVLCVSEKDNSRNGLPNQRR